MSANLAQKQQVVEGIADVARTASAGVVAEYRGLSVFQLTNLRAKARSEQVYLRVVKNTLSRRALNGTNFECLKEWLVGPTILAFSLEDPSAAARVLQDFGKDKANAALVVKGLGLEGEAIPASDLERVARLPKRDEALAALMTCMRAPVDRLAQTINEVPGKLVRTIDAIRQMRAAS